MNNSWQVLGSEEKIEGLKAKLLAGLETGSSLEVIAKENQLKVDSYNIIHTLNYFQPGYIYSLIINGGNPPYTFYIENSN